MLGWYKQNRTASESIRLQLLELYNIHTQLQLEISTLVSIKQVESSQSAE